MVDGRKEAQNVLALFDCFHYLIWFVLIVAFSRHSLQLGQDSLVSVWMISTLRILQFFLSVLAAQFHSLLLPLLSICRSACRLSSQLD